jgi:hypothetical protein
MFATAQWINEFCRPTVENSSGFIPSFKRLRLSKCKDMRKGAVEGAWRILPHEEAGITRASYYYFWLAAILPKVQASCPVSVVWLLRIARLG